MSKINDGGPAFPSHGSMGEVVQHGMSLRDWFAGQALITELANSGIDTPRFALLVEMADAECVPVHAIMARDCYAMADAMLAAREET